MPSMLGEGRIITMARRRHTRSRSSASSAKLTGSWQREPKSPRWRRALLFLAGVVALSCVLAVVLGSHGEIAPTASTAAPGRPCTVVQQVSVGLDLNLPLCTSAARADCDLTRDPASRAAAWLIPLCRGIWAGIRHDLIIASRGSHCLERVHRNPNACSLVNSQLGAGREGGAGPVDPGNHNWVRGFAGADRWDSLLPAHAPAGGAAQACRAGSQRSRRCRLTG
jgi:hypothetical protein